MPKPTVLDDLVLDFVKLFERHLDLVERRYRRARRKLTLGKPNGNLTVRASRIGAWYYREISIYLSHLDELYLRIGLYGDLVPVNKEANAMAGRLMKQAAKLSDDAATSAVVHIGLEAHHFIPQTVLKDFPILKIIYPDEKIMPAINLTKLEHRGSLKLLERLKESGSLPGILRNVPEGQGTESVTKALNDLVSKVRQEVVSSSVEAEREITKKLLNEIEKLYDQRFPNMLDQSVDLGEGRRRWSMREWIQKTRSTVDTIPLTQGNGGSLSYAPTF